MHLVERGSNGSAMTNRTKAVEPQNVNRGRHSKRCAICSHEQRNEIERDFIAWNSPQVILAHTSCPTALQSTVTRTPLVSLKRGSGTSGLRWSASLKEPEMWKDRK